MFAKGCENLLDLTKVAGQVRDMAGTLLELQNCINEKLSLSRDLLAGADWQSMAQRVRESKTSMLTAIPTGELNEVVSSPVVPKKFSVVAADGSQIVPDHHGPALCYLLNIGRIMIHYGTGERPLLDSIPYLFYREEDMYLEENGRQVMIQGDILAAKRSELEGSVLGALVEEAQKRPYSPGSLAEEAEYRAHPVVAIEDGSLIKWTLEQGAGWQNQVLQRYLQSLQRARELNTPVCGYLSGSRACDAVNMLKLMLCPETPVNCDKCPYKGREIPCRKLNGVTDTMLFKRALPEIGDRSQVFLSSSKVLERYGEHRTGFFYLNVGKEIARVEVPAWVWQDRRLLDLVHAVVADQAVKGMGYPVVLTEAHEQAVVKGADRDAFIRLLESSLVKQGTPVVSSPKNLRKRVGFV